MKIADLGKLISYLKFGIENDKIKKALEKISMYL